MSPESLQRGHHWLSLMVKNLGNQKLEQLDVKVHPSDSLRISFDYPSDYISSLDPKESRTLYFQVDAEGTTDLYVSVSCLKGGNYFYWDSPWVRERVVGEKTELESVFVSNPYGTIGKELDVEATVKGLSSAGISGLHLQFWADSPSGKYIQLADIKPKTLSNGEEASYTAKNHSERSRILYGIRESLRRLISQCGKEDGYHLGRAVDSYFEMSAKNSISK